jgi:hypothetical protein
METKKSHPELSDAARDATNPDPRPAVVIDADVTDPDPRAVDVTDPDPRPVDATDPDPRPVLTYELPSEDLESHALLGKLQTRRAPPPVTTWVTDGDLAAAYAVHAVPPRRQVTPTPQPAVVVDQADRVSTPQPIRVTQRMRTLRMRTPQAGRTDPTVRIERRRPDAAPSPAGVRTGRLYAAIAALGVLVVVGLVVVAATMTTARDRASGTTTMLSAGSSAAASARPAITTTAMASVAIAPATVSTMTLTSSTALQAGMAPSEPPPLAPVSPAPARRAAPSRRVAPSAAAPATASAPPPAAGPAELEIFQ